MRRFFAGRANLTTSKFVEAMRTVDGVVVVRISGNFTVGSTPKICRSLGTMVEAHSVKGLVLDLGNVSEVDTTAFACLISLIKSSFRNEKRIGVCNLQPTAKNLIQILKIHGIVHAFSSMDEATEYFRKLS